eukprot:jgi/Mesvir1/28001/Mv20195-RA.1
MSGLGYIGTDAGLLANLTRLEQNVHGMTMNVAYMQQAMNTFTFEQSLCLLLIMISGYTVLKVGGVRAGNSKATIIQSFMTMIASMFGWQLLGWSLLFEKGEFITDEGKRSHPFLADPIRNAINVEDSGLSVWSIHSCLAGIASSIACSSLAERTTLSTYLLYPFVISAFLYPTTAHWVWSTDGWLARSGRAGMAFHDFTGGATCFMLAGAAGLIGTIVVGPRKGRFISNRRATAIREHNLILVGLGVCLIWTGWYGLRNGVYATVRNGLDNLPLPMISMTLSACTGGLVSMVIGYKRKGFVGFVPLSNGVLGGLVAVTAGADVLPMWTTLIIGAVAACVYHALAALLQSRQVDDPFGFIAVHLGCGAWGALAVGLFADGHVRVNPHMHIHMVTPTNEVAVQSLFLNGSGRQLIYQLVGVTTMFAWAIFVGGLTLLAVRRWSLRVAPEAEYRGLDLALHGGTLYPDFMVKAFKKDDVPNNWATVVCVRVHGLDQLLRAAPPAVIKSAFRTYHNCLREQAFVMSGKEVLLIPTDDASSEGGGTRVSCDMSPMSASPSGLPFAQPHMHRSSSELPFILPEGAGEESEGSRNHARQHSSHRSHEEKVSPAPISNDTAPPRPATDTADALAASQLTALANGGGLANGGRNVSISVIANGGSNTRTSVSAGAVTSRSRPRTSYDGVIRNLGQVDLGMLLANASAAGLTPEIIAQLSRRPEAGGGLALASNSNAPSGSITPPIVPAPTVLATGMLAPAPLGLDGPIAGTSIPVAPLSPRGSSSDATSESQSNSSGSKRRMRFSFSSGSGIKAWRRSSSEGSGTVDEIGVLHFVFHSPDEAVRWCMAVQGALLECYWAPELLALPSTGLVYQSVDGREDKTLPPVFRGMRTCMGIHCGDITLTYVKTGLPALGGATGLVSTAVAMAVPMPGGVYATEAVIRHLDDPTHMKQRLPNGRRLTQGAGELTYFHHGDHQLLGIQKKVSIIQLVDAVTRRRGVGIPHSSTVLSPSVVDAPGFWDVWSDPDARPLVSLVFTFIAGLPRLRSWDEEATARAIKAHNALLRDELQRQGGYECQEESGAFMLAFHSVDAALTWAATVQLRLLQENVWEPPLLGRKEASAEMWKGAATPTVRHTSGSRPWSMLSSFTMKTSGLRRNRVTKMLAGRSSPQQSHADDASWEGGSASDSGSPHVGGGGLSPEYLFRGLRVKMGVHWGPATAVRPHTTTGRADYFGSVVNQTARIAYSAQGGQVLVSGPALEASTVKRRAQPPPTPDTAAEKKPLRLSNSMSRTRAPPLLQRLPSLPAMSSSQRNSSPDNGQHVVDMPGFSATGGDESGHGGPRGGGWLPRLRSLNVRTPKADLDEAVTGAVEVNLPGAAATKEGGEAAHESTVPGEAVFLKEQNFKGVGHPIAVYELVVRGLEARQSYFALSSTLGGGALSEGGQAEKGSAYIPLGLDSDALASPTAAPKPPMAMRSASTTPALGEQSPEGGSRQGDTHKKRRGTAMDWFFGSLTDMMGSREVDSSGRRQTTF